MGRVVAISSLLATTLFASSVEAAPSVVEQLEQISNLADDVVGRSKFISEQFNRKSAGVAKRSRQARLENGEVLFLLKDYRNAAIVLFDLVEDPAMKDDPGYVDAVYFLAESLFQDGNLSAARIYFNRLVDLNSPQISSAILRLIEIAGGHGDFVEVRKVFERFEQRHQGRIPPQVDYFFAKALIQGGAYDEALKRLERPAAEGVYVQQASYARGVALAASGKLQDAADAFDAMLKFKPTTPSQVALRELTHLARGRLNYELGKIDASIDAYQSIGHQSERFDEMLFEITWAYVKSAESKVTELDKNQEYQKAVRSVEILLASNPHSPIVPEAKVLLGNLHLRLKQYGLAVKAFDQVINDYEPGQNELRRIIRERGDPMRYFREIIASGLDKLSAESLLPPVALDWAQGDASLAQATRIFQQLRRGETDLDDAEQLVERILTRLEGDRRINMFPALADQQGRAVEVSAQAADAERRLLELETVILEGAGLDLTGLRALRSRRMALQEKVDKLPPTMARRAEMVDSVSRRLGALKQRLFRLTIELKGFKKTLSAVDAYVAERRKKGNLSREELGFFQINVPVLRDMIKEMDQAALRINNEIENEQAGFGSGAGSDEFALRARYRQTIAEEQEAVAQLRARLAGEDVNSLRRIDAIRQRVTGAQESIDDLLRRLEQVVVMEAGALRGRVMVEAGRLKALRDEERQLAKQAEASTIGAVNATLNSVSNKFYGILRDADLGKIDVAWEEKEADTRGITKLGRAKETEMLRIREQFDEALGGASSP